jgi:anti-sigma B factor antagonist
MGAPIFQIERVGPTMVVSPKRNVAIDADVKKELSRLLEALESGDVQSIIFDFGHVDYCASSILEAMLRLQKSLPKGKGKLIVCCINSVIRESLHITRFDTLWTIFDTRDEALKAAEA